MFLNYREIEGFNCPIMIILSRRGLGKTFSPVLKCVRDFVLYKKRFVYVVETLEMVKTLSQAKGDKFFSNIFSHLEGNGVVNPSKSEKRLFRKIRGKMEVTEEDVFSNANEGYIKGGAIYINNEIAGYIVAFNDFGNLKRNNFKDIKRIIIDEFIPEKINITNKNDAYKMVSVIQSIARLQDIKVYMLGNSIRLNDVILTKLKLDNLVPGEKRVIKDDYGPLILAYLVDNKMYQSFTEKANSSVAGRFASILDSDQLENNEFRDSLSDKMKLPNKLPPNKFILCLHGDAGSVRIHANKGHTQIYVLSDYGENVSGRICIEEKYVSSIVKYQKIWRDALISFYQNKEMFFESSNVHFIFKSILKLET